MPSTPIGRHALISGLSGGLLADRSRRPSDQPRRSRSRSPPGAARLAERRGLGRGLGFGRAAGFGRGRGLVRRGWPRRRGLRPRGSAGSVTAGLRVAGTGGSGLSSASRLPAGARRGRSAIDRRGGRAERGGAAARGWAATSAAAGRVEQGELQLEAQAARTQPRRVDGRRAGGRRPISAAPSAVARRRPASSRSRMASTTWSRNTRRSRPRSSSRSSRSMPAAASPGRERRHEPVDELRLGEARAGRGPPRPRCGRRSRRGAGRGSTPRRASRPRRGRATRAIASGSASRPSAARIRSSLPLISGTVSRRTSNRWSRDRIAGGNSCGWVRREHERDELGRLLERLEERVPGVPRDLVRLVEDVDLAPQVGRRVVEPVAELAHRR